VRDEGGDAMSIQRDAFEEPDRMDPEDEPRRRGHYVEQPPPFDFMPRAKDSAHWHVWAGLGTAMYATCETCYGAPPTLICAHCNLESCADCSRSYKEENRCHG